MEKGILGASNPEINITLILSLILKIPQTSYLPNQA
jgi:hypothetical protein